MSPGNAEGYVVKKRCKFMVFACVVCTLIAWPERQRQNKKDFSRGSHKGTGKTGRGRLLHYVLCWEFWHYKVRVKEENTLLSIFPTEFSYSYWWIVVLFGQGFMCRWKLLLAEKYVYNPSLIINSITFFFFLIIFPLCPKTTNKSNYLVSEKLFE